MDWNLVRSFLAVVDGGSLSAAARQTGLSQPTLGRHIDQLETALGAGLFDRSVQGLVLTDKGINLVEDARQMQRAMHGFLRKASGQEQEIKGSVRIAANEVIGLEVLPRALVDFRLLYPDIQVELVVSNTTTSLSRRESDLAIRMYQPAQSSLRARRLPDLPLAFYAHRDYVARRGMPCEQEDFIHHDLIGFDQDRSFIDGAAAMGVTLTENDFAFRCDSLMAQINALRNGLGIAGSHCGLLDDDPDLVRVFSDIPLPPLPCWLVCHSDVIHNRRIRVLMDFLYDWMTANPYFGPKGRPVVQGGCR